MGHGPDIARVGTALGKGGIRYDPGHFGRYRMRGGIVLHALDLGLFWGGNAMSDKAINLCALFIMLALMPLL